MAGAGELVARVAGGLCLLLAAVCVAHDVRRRMRVGKRLFPDMNRFVVIWNMDVGAGFLLALAMIILAGLLFSL